MVDVSPAIVPKSDQTNYDDFLGGPRTVRITKVTLAVGEQPLAVHYENDNGKPWKPCKQMMRALVALYSKESDRWIGHSLTLFGDPTVTFGKDAVGGIRISHATGITKVTTLNLTVAKGRRSKYTIQPLIVADSDTTPERANEVLQSAAANGLSALQAAWGALPAATRKAISPSGCPADLKATAESIDKARTDAEAARNDIDDALAGGGELVEG